MSKRNPDGFVKKPRDFYGTIDPAAARALKPFLDGGTKYIEPCAGSLDLARMLGLETNLFCVGTYDIQPEHPSVVQRNCLTLTKDDLNGAQYFITNPPFSWNMLKPILDHLPSLLPTWLLLPADYMHNVRMGPYIRKCSDITSIGRMYWEPNKVKGVDNYCWYLFDDRYSWGTNFYGRE